MALNLNGRLSTLRRLSILLLALSAHLLLGTGAAYCAGKDSSPKPIERVVNFEQVGMFVVKLEGQSM
jgi:hypothetical protein